MPISSVEVAADSITKLSSSPALLIGMDSWNIRNMRNICGGDPEGKIVMLMDFTRRPGDVADPWYTGDFEATWRDVLEGCQALLEHLTMPKVK